MGRRPDPGRNASQRRKAARGQPAHAPGATAPSAGDPVAARVKALKLQAAALVKESRLADAGGIAAELLGLDEQALTSGDPGIARDMIDIAGTLMPTGQFSSLEQLFLKGIRVLWNHPQATVNDFFLPVNNLAALYGASGNYPARDQANSRILALAEQLAVPITSQVAQVFIHLGSLYERAGRPKAAAILYRPLHPFMMAQDEIALETRVEWIGMYAKVLMADSQFEQALQMGEQALSALQASPGFDDGHRIGILNLMGSAARAKGADENAEALFERAADIARLSEAHKDGKAAGAVYHNLASLYLQRGRRDRYDEAERLLEHALAIVAQAGRRDSAEYAGELGQLATVVEAKGEVERAEAHYRESFRVYGSASDTPPAEFADFLTDGGFLYLRLRRPADAVACFRRAHALRESLAGLSPLALANTASNLATAHFEAGNFAEATRCYREAIDLRHGNREFVEGGSAQLPVAHAP